MRRRTFLLGSLAAVGLGACGGGPDGRDATDDSSSTTMPGNTTTTRGRAQAASNAPNVLFISLDDCNDWLGFLNNHPGTHTPNLDALAAESLVFNHAYTAAPMCLPSRSAVMFGKPAFESKVYDHGKPSREAYESLQEANPSLVDAFTGGGYNAYSVGKIFHDPQKERWDDSFRQPWYVEPAQRDEKRYEGRFDPDWTSPYDGAPIGGGTEWSGPVDFGPSGRSPEDDPDGQGTEWVVDRLRQNHDRPFFIGHGVYLPHVPWRLPQQFFDLHPLDEVVVPELRPDDLDDLGPYARGEIIDTHRAFARLYESGQWQQAVQAYQAAISYADWCVGQVLDELRSGPHADDTIVAVWSDHGFHLGEKLHLHKFTLWERATRVPLVLNVPGQFDEHQTFEPPVSLLDLGPTLIDLAGLDALESHEGQSLLPLVDDPARADDHPPVMTWLEGNHAVRRGSWRYIRYRTNETELYDLESDPDEFTNLSDQPEHADLQVELDRYLPDPIDD